jgi:cytochrome c peroxidase
MVHQLRHRCPKDAETAAMNLPPPRPIATPLQVDVKRDRRCSGTSGSEVFITKGRCAECHIPQTAFMDNNMHDLKLERFYKPGQTVNDFVVLPDGPIKTFTLRGIKDSPPYMHDGRLLTLADTVEFFNLVLSLKLSQSEKDDLVAYLLTL